MADTQIPKSWLDRTETFDFGTITGQQNQQVTTIDLSDPVINYSIVDYMNATYPGKARAYLNGKINLDTNIGTYYLTGDNTKSGYLSFTQSKDDIDRGLSVTMPLSGQNTSGEGSVGHGSDEQIITPTDWKTYSTDSSAWLSTADITHEKQAISQGYASHGHNSYAYRVQEHADYDKVDDQHKLDIGTGPGVQPLPAGTGVFTTRMMNLPRAHLNSSRGAVNTITGVTSKEQARSISRNNPTLWSKYVEGSDYYQYLTHEQSTGAHTNHTKGYTFSSQYNNKIEDIDVFEPDGVTPDTMSTFFNQQKLLQRGYYGVRDYANNVDLPGSQPNLQYGTHWTLSMSVKLGSNIAMGEYVPVCFIDRVDSLHNKTLDNKLGNWAGTNDTRKSQAIDIKHRLSSSTGTSSDDTDYWKHLCQWFTLTTNHLSNTKRQIKDMVILIGKPAGGNSNGGQYEMVVYAPGHETHVPYGTLGNSGSGWSFSYYTIYNTRTGCKPPRITKIPIDKPGDGFSPGDWNPLFFHFASNDVLRHKLFSHRNTYRARLHIYSYSTSVGGVAVGAFGPGIMDFTPDNFGFSDLSSAISTRTLYDGSYYSRQGQYTGTKAGDDNYMCTFLAVPDKVQGIANVNMHTYRDNHFIPRESGHENNPQSITYFPQRTVGYEAIGAGSELVNTGQGTWKDIDFIVDQSTETAASSFGLGEEHALEIHTKLAPPAIDSKLTSDSIVKHMTIEVRGINKRYLNPGLTLNYVLWNYKDQENPQPITTVVAVRPDGSTAKDSHLEVSLSLTGENITYDMLNHCRLRIWSDG